MFSRNHTVEVSRGSVRGHWACANQCLTRPWPTGLDKKLIVSIIFQAKMSNICCFRPTKCMDFFAFFVVFFLNLVLFCRSKLKMSLFVLGNCFDVFGTLLMDSIIVSIADRSIQSQFLALVHAQCPAVALYVPAESPPAPPCRGCAVKQTSRQV